MGSYLTVEGRMLIPLKLFIPYKSRCILDAQTAGSGDLGDSVLYQACNGLFSLLVMQEN